MLSELPAEKVPRCSMASNPESSEASRSKANIEESIVEKEKRQTTMTIFFYHEVKVVLISYLYPGTFVKKKKCAHRYKINDKLCNFSLNHDFPIPEI